MVKIETLVHQAPAAAATYLREAVNHIDRVLGEGYAKKNPNLVAAFVQVCATDFDTLVRAAIARNELQGG